LLSCSPLINTVVINVSQAVNSVHTSSVDQSGKRSKDIPRFVCSLQANIKGRYQSLWTSSNDLGYLPKHM